jgi:hypothetical protein
MTTRKHNPRQEQPQREQATVRRDTSVDLSETEGLPQQSLLGNRATTAMLQRWGEQPLVPDLARLQRTIGNKAVGRILRKPATSSQPTTIQRLSWSDPVVGDQIQNVVRIAPSKPVWKIEYTDNSAVIIKFEHITGRRGGDQTALQELGRMEGVRELFNVGMKKRSVVGGRHCEPSEIVDALKDFHKISPSTNGSKELLSAAAQTDEEMFVNDYATGIEDMTHDDGDNGRTRMDGSPDYTTYTNNKQRSLQLLIFNKPNLTDLGRMIYLDTLMGSQDRLGRVNMNLENITFKDDGMTEGSVLALDNFDPNATLDNLQQGGGMARTTEQKMLETIYTSRRHVYAVNMLVKFYQLTGYVGGNIQLAAETSKDSKYLLAGMDEAERSVLGKLKGVIKGSLNDDMDTPGSYHGEKATYLQEIYRRAKEAKRG